MHRVFDAAPPSTAVFAMFSAAMLVAAWAIASFTFVPILDHVNLAFHEVGHPLFGLFGDTLQWLGGSLMQFVFPSLTTWHFLRRGEVLAGAACTLWWLENLRYLAAYVGDARAQALPLVGGGEHDWATLLGRWGWLQHDTRIAAVLVFLCWSGWLLVWASVAWWWWRGRQADLQVEAIERRQRVIREARDRAARKPPG